MKSLAGKNVLITGSTGTIGQEVVQALVNANLPGKIALFSRDDSMLKRPVSDLIKVPEGPQKKVYSYEVDFLDPNKITNKINKALNDLKTLDAVIFCHGVINY